MGADPSKIFNSNFTRFYISSTIYNPSDFINGSQDNKLIKRESIDIGENTIDKSFNIENKSLSTNFDDIIDQVNSSNSCSRESDDYNLSNKNQISLDKEIKKIYNSKNSETNTITIFDWDDTLFPTTYLMQKIGNSMESLSFSLKEKSKIKELEIKIVKLLTKALEKGIVFIITNSCKGWVERCIKLYYPKLSPLLDDINIISARELYEKEFPDNKEMWKNKTCIELSKYLKIDNSIKTNIICFGDSNLEINSAQAFANEFINYTLKTVKFLENPDLFQLFKQIYLIELQFKIIYNFPKNLSISVGKKSNKNF